MDRNESSDRGNGNESSDRKYENDRPSDAHEPDTVPDDRPMDVERDEPSDTDERSPLRRRVSLLATASLVVWFVVHFLFDGWPEGAILAGGFVAVDLGASLREGSTISGGVSALILGLLAAIALPPLEVSTLSLLIFVTVGAVLVVLGYRYVE